MTACCSPMPAMRATIRGDAGCFVLGADNVGWRDQRYTAEYQRTGKFVISGLWDQIPQFYSVDTKTPYSPSPSPLLLDDATQQQVQNGQATLSAYVPIAPQFDLQERRDIGHVSLVATPKPTLDLTAAFTTQRHVGELPWGASFGFGNDVEVALPYDSRTNDFNLGAEWTNTRQMFRVAYTGSWFDNLDDTLTWDSPLRLTDSTSAPGRGRMALWPSNSAQTVSAAGFAKFAHRTQLTGFMSFGSWSNDRAASALHDQRDAATAGAAQDQRGRRSERLFHESESRVPARGRVAIQRARAAIRLRQPDRGNPHPPVHQLRHVADDVVHGWPRALRS